MNPSKACFGLLIPLLVLGLMACGDEDEDSTTLDSTGGSARVGEPCEQTSDCKDDLACLADEQRCVVLCDPGSDQCGEGIACMTAGSVGFCPPPALPES
ncbi:MAG: hypothetical protein AAFX99_04325 [Myxococcota bacterium]